MSFLNPIAGGHQNAGLPPSTGQSPLDILRSLLNQGVVDGEAIIVALGGRITRQQLETLVDKLMKLDKQYYEVEFPASLREVKVGEKGGISISPTRVAALGLQAVFAPESVLNIVRDGNALVISVKPDAAAVTAETTAPATPPVAPPATAPAPQGATQ